jgi:hypothetical protein
MSGSFENCERRNLKQPDLSAVEFRIASNRDELNQACRLVYDAYRLKGLIPANPYQMRVTPYHLLDTSEFLIAVLGNQVISTALLVRDGKLGIPMESLYANEVANQRLQGNSIAEVSCLADRRNESRWTFPVLLRLMSLITQCAAFREIDRLLIAVHPRHARFYRRYLGFETIGPERAYLSVQGNPAVALSLDLNQLAENHPHGYQALFGNRFDPDVFRQQPVDAQWNQEVANTLRAVRLPTTEPLTPSNSAAMAAELSVSGLVVSH